MVADLESRGVAEESQGALVIRVEDYGIREPLLRPSVLKSLS